MFARTLAISWRECRTARLPMTSSRCPPLEKVSEEIRIWDESGTYRVIYTARVKGSVYVLHAFQKKTQTTLKRDIEVARSRFNELMRGTV